MNSSVLILCLILQSCSLISVNGKEAGISCSFDDFVNKMKSFKTRLIGTEQDANCSKEQMDADFKEAYGSVKRDSCSVDNYSLDRRVQSKGCPKVKVEGYFDKSS